MRALGLQVLALHQRAQWGGSEIHNNIFITANGDWVLTRSQALLKHFACIYTVALAVGIGTSFISQIAKQKHVQGQTLSRAQGQHAAGGHNQSLFFLISQWKR